LEKEGLSDCHRSVPSGTPRVVYDQLKIQLIQQAGTHNVSQALAIIVYFLLRNEDQEAALRGALEPIFTANGTSRPSLKELEKVPYLSACIKEGLRQVYSLVT
jgi:cytochrome P450